MSPSPTEIPYGTLDLMVLRTLEQLGPLHGYGIARRIEQIAEGMLALNQGTIGRTEGKWLLRLDSNPPSLRLRRPGQQPSG